MSRTMKRNFVGTIALVLALSLCAFICTVPTTAHATVNLPFTLVAPQNVMLTKADGDSPTTMGYAYGYTNEIVDFFVGYANANDAGTLAAYLQSKGVDYADEMWLNIQIDWALDDVNDAVSGWHYNAYWDEAPLGSLGQDADGKYQNSTWDVVDTGVQDATQAVNSAWLYRGMTEWTWLGNETFVGLKDQLRPSQYTFDNYNDNGDVDLYIDWTQHTIYNRSRFVIVLRDLNANEDSYVFSDWSAVSAYGKDAATVEPLKPGDVVAPTITGLRLTDEKFNDNPVVAFTLTVPDSLAAQKAQIAAANGTLRVEVEGRIKGTTEWKDLHVAGDITTGELTAALVYLAEQGKTFPEGTEVELRARYLIGQNGQDDFYSGYSKIIGFDSDDIVYNESPGTESVGDGNGNSIRDLLPKSDCKICHFCPQPLGLCIFIWLAIIVAILIVIAVVILVLKKSKRKDKERD